MLKTAENLCWMRLGVVGGAVIKTLLFCQFASVRDREVGFGVSVRSRRERNWKHDDDGSEKRCGRGADVPEQDMSLQGETPGLEFEPATWQIRKPERCVM